jgi:hypothetical protein
LFLDLQVVLAASPEFPAAAVIFATEYILHVAPSAVKSAPVQPVGDPPLYIVAKAPPVGKASVPPHANKAVHSARQVVSSVIAVYPSALLTAVAPSHN